MEELRFIYGSSPAAFDFLPQAISYRWYEMVKNLSDLKPDHQVKLVIFLDWEPIREQEAKEIFSIMEKIYPVASFCIAAGWPFIPEKIKEHPRYVGMIACPFDFQPLEDSLRLILGTLNK